MMFFFFFLFFCEGMNESEKQNVQRGGTFVSNSRVLSRVVGGMKLKMVEVEDSYVMQYSGVILFFLFIFSKVFYILFFEFFIKWINFQS
jgi:hypothetical protein